MLVLKMYSIVGQLRKAVRDAFPLWDLMDHPFEDKIDFMAYLNIRGKLTIFIKFFNNMASFKFRLFFFNYCLTNGFN